MYHETHRLYTWQGYDLQCSTDHRPADGMIVRIFPHDDNARPIADLVLGRASFLDARQAGINWLDDRGMVAGSAAFGPVLRACYLNATSTVDAAIGCCIAHYSYDVDPRLSSPPLAPAPDMPRERRYYVAKDNNNPNHPFFRVEGPTATPAEDAAVIRTSFPHWGIGTIVAVLADGATIEVPAPVTA